MHMPSGLIKAVASWTTFRKVNTRYRMTYRDFVVVFSSVCIVFVSLPATESVLIIYFLSKY